jgi:hypothetical protein
LGAARSYPRLRRRARWRTCQKNLGSGFRQASPASHASSSLPPKAHPRTARHLPGRDPRTALRLFRSLDSPSRDLVSLPRILFSPPRDVSARPVGLRVAWHTSWRLRPDARRPAATAAPRTLAPRTTRGRRRAQLQCPQMTWLRPRVCRARMRPMPILRWRVAAAEPMAPPQLPMHNVQLRRAPSRPPALMRLTVLAPTRTPILPTGSSRRSTAAKRLAAPAGWPTMSAKCRREMSRLAEV